MTLNATARQANIKDSLKKFTIDEIETGKGISISWDKALSAPNTVTSNRWVNFIMGPAQKKLLGDVYLKVYCCTREDNEGYRLMNLVDHVIEVFSVDYDTAHDTAKRITLYQSHPTNAWTEIGVMLVQEIMESDDLTAPDETKYRQLTIKLGVPMKV